MNNDTHKRADIGVPPQASGSAFRAGDIVRHAKTGEEWELACDEERGEVMPAGWPMCIAKAEDCDLVRPASDEVRLRTLYHAASLDNSKYDERISRARQQWQNNQLSGRATEGGSRE